MSRELAERGHRVIWIQFGRKQGRSSADGLQFVTVTSFGANPLTPFFSIFRMTLHCLAKRVQVAYVDEWLFSRDKPSRRLALFIGLRIAGVKVVLDERDPFVDFEIASGWVSPGSERLGQLQRSQRLLQRLANLLILPSKAYADLLISEGIPGRKVLGAFRGIDTDLFTPNQDPSLARASLGIDGKFVIGWFGLMLPYRLVREVMVPLIEGVNQVIPNAHVVIGGEGPLRSEFDRLVGRGDLPLSLVGMVAYDDLPRYISACNVLLCPVDDRFRFSNYSAWLKIAESLAVGRPIVASKTMIAVTDFKDLKGVVWVPSSLQGFMRGLKEVYDSYESYLSLARDQANDFGTYSTKKTVAAIANRLESLSN